MSLDLQLVQNNMSKKIIIPKDSLPPFSAEYNAYIHRYRIVSKDGSRSSAWSNNIITDVLSSNATVPEVGQTIHHVAVSQSNETITVVWTPPQSLKTNTYDVYISWSGGNWQFVSQVSGPSFATNIDTAETTAQVAVQVPTYPKIRHSEATLFETAIINV